MKAAHATRFRQAGRWVAVALAAIGYSLLAHRAAAAATPDALDAMVAVVPLLGLAFLMAWRSPQRPLMLALWLVPCAGLYETRSWFAAHFQWIFLLQHVGMYTLLAVAFGRTLRAGRTPIVTGFAALVHRTLSPALLSYTRSVTWAWTLYFSGTVALSLLLFWLAPTAVWSAFANLLDIPLLVLMFAAEYGVRCLVLAPADRAGPLEAIRAWRQASSRSTAHQP